MLLRLRMVGEYSTPVRPPSYMPRFDYQSFWFQRYPGPENSPGTLHMYELRVSLGHHSNGQQYCRFDENTKDQRSADGASLCPALKPAPLSQQVNARSGDFSTDYYQLTAHYAYLHLGRDSREQSRVSAGITFEDNPLWFGSAPGAIDHQEFALYGPHRIKVEVAGGLHLTAPCDWASGVAELSVSAEYFWRTGVGVVDNREFVELHYVFDSLGGAGLFARFFSGQDYLNVLFLEPRATTIQFGLIWDFSPRLQYRFSPG